MVEDVARDGKFVNPVTDFLTKQGAKLSRYCKKGTLTVVCSGTAKTVGQASFLNSDACIHDGFLAMVNIRDDFSPEFVYYQVQKFQAQAERVATHGGTFINLTTSILKDFKRAFPPLPEQCNITGFLSAVDGRIEGLEKKRELLKKYKKGLMQKLFNQSLRFENGNQPFPGWTEKRMEEVATFLKGKGLSKSDIAENGKTECIRYGELYTHYNELISVVRSKTNVDKCELVLSEENDVVIPASGETQIDIATASCIQKKGIAIGGDLNIIRTSNNSVFLSYYLNNKLKYDIARLAQGVSVIHLYPTHLKTLKLFLPSPDEQKKIADCLSAVDRKIGRVETQVLQTRAFKQGLLQKMFV